MVRRISCPDFVIRAIRFTLAALMLCSPLTVRSAFAQDASQRPPHAGEVVSALERAQWDVLNEGFWVMRVDTPLGTRITALSIDRDRFGFSIIPQNNSKGERASQVLRRVDAAAVINGGFFSMETDETLKPVGRLIVNGEAQSAAWNRSGGYLALDAAGQPSITLSPAGDPVGAPNAVQSKPVLIEPGRVWAMNTNGTELARRTLICLKQDNTALLVIVHGNGLTLFEAGWVLRGREWGGFFDCDSAIAMDGGGSTQLAVRDHHELSITGLTRVQNSIAVIERNNANAD